MDDFVFGMAAGVDEEGTCLYAYSRNSNIMQRVERLDLETGARTIVSSEDDGLGPQPGVPLSLVHDAARDQLVVLDLSPTSSAMIAIDLATGVRTLLPAELPLPNPLFFGEGELLMDPENDRLLFVHSREGAVLAYEFASQRTVELSGPTRGRGPSLAAPAGITVDPRTGTLYVTDRARGMVLAIDPATGDRAVATY